MKYSPEFLSERDFDSMTQGTKQAEKNQFTDLSPPVVHPCLTQGHKRTHVMQSGFGPIWRRIYTWVYVK